MTSSTIAATPRPLRIPTWRLALSRTGVVLTMLMATMNTINGGSALLGVQSGEPVSPVIAALLFGIGLPTLILVVPAWKSVQWALVTVIALRALEALTMWVPMGPGDWYSAPENRPFYVLLVVVSLAVCALMSLGLRRRA
ncbi:MAG: hypothetical protein ACLGIA_09240 [Actinomycetes bacterium]